VIVTVTSIPLLIPMLSKGVVFSLSLMCDAPLPETLGWAARGRANSNAVEMTNDQ
jgi:hypothetical protein